MNEGILSTIGHTPLVKLSRVVEGAGFNLYGKLESFNPAGSMKDRVAFSIIKHAIEDGSLRPDSTVIESSSGNMGVGMAQVCCYYGMRFICVVDPKTTKQNLEIIRAFGAELDLVTEPDPETGEFLPARVKRVKALLDIIPGSVWLDQYSNLYNVLAHWQTMGEIVSELDGRVDYLFCATSTCGTLRGCTEYLRAHGLRTKVVAVDAIGSVLFGGDPGKRLIAGHGASIVPALYRAGLADALIRVSDLECVVGCRRLARYEAILAGGSSGAILTAIERMRDELPHGGNCVAILPDRGERYLDTIFSNAWVRNHFGEVSHLWEEMPLRALETH